MVVGIEAGGDTDAGCTDRQRSRHVLQGVAHHHHVARVGEELLATGHAGAQYVAPRLGVAPVAAEAEVVAEAGMAELSIGSGAHVPGADAESHAIGLVKERIEALLRPWHLLDFGGTTGELGVEARNVGRHQGVDGGLVVGEARAHEATARDGSIGHAREREPTLPRPATDGAHRALESATPGALGVEERSVDIEKDDAHDERSMPRGGTTVETGLVETPAAPASPASVPFAEPSPLGLLCLAIGCAALVPIAFGTAVTPDAIRTAAIFCLLFGAGGQFLAGIMSLANKNLLGGTLFTTFAFNWVYNWWSLSGLTEGKVPNGDITFAVDVCFIIIFVVLTYAFGFYSKLLFLFLLDIDFLYASRILNHALHTKAFAMPIALCTIFLVAIALYMAFGILVNTAAGRVVFPIPGPMFKPGPGAPPAAH